MARYGEIQVDFYQEKSRIIGALHKPENHSIVMRLIGALAFRTHCPKYGYIQDALGRVFTDIDFATYAKHIRDVRRLMVELGYVEDKMVTRLFGENRMLYHDPVYGRHVDIFIDRLDFCHILPLSGRLEADQETLPLAELLLEKMQIVELNEKDIIDSIMLLREHPIGITDVETINSPIICRLTANDWGLWRTVTGNLKLVDELLFQYSRLTEDDKKVVSNRIKELQTAIEIQPKSTRWKIRSTVGERVKWYRQVEKLENRGV